MDPETRKALDRAYRRELRNLWIWPLALVLIIGGIAALLFMPQERVGVVEATFERFIVLPSDDGASNVLLLALPDGRTTRMTARPGDAALIPGASLCLVEMRHPVLRRASFVRVPSTRCTEELGEE